MYGGGYYNTSFGNNNFRPSFPIHDANGDGYVTEYDFTLMARQNGWSQPDVAVSAFRQLDKNRNGILDKEDITRAFGYMDRLYNDNYFPRSVTSLEPKQSNFYDRLDNNNFMPRPYPNNQLNNSLNGGPGINNTGNLIRPSTTFTPNLEIPRDYDRDGRITEVDFIRMYKEKGWRYAGEDVARSAFRKMDKNRNGYLDRDEMNSAFGLLDRLYK